MEFRAVFWVFLVVIAALVLSACAGSDPSFPEVDGSVVTEDYLISADNQFCLPDNDGQVEWNEINFVAGLAADFVVNPPGTMAKLNPNGKLVGNKLEWDFSGQNGVVVRMAVEKVKGQWFEHHFPGADIAMGTTAKADTLQILDVDAGEENVKLLGIVSRQPDHTLTIYDPPIVAMRFPLKRGDSFKSCSKTKDGSKISALPFYSEDCYEISIKKEGMLKLPHLRLHRVLLIETLVTIKTLGGVKTTTRQLQWFSECYGEVVRALSRSDESSPLFTQALELRRLSL